MIRCYSQRLYDELKTFVWKGQKAQAMRGQHDDLVMSLAIGTWLYDASADYSKNSKALNDAMLSAMKVEKKIYDQTPEAALKEVNTIPVYRSGTKYDKRIVKTDVNKAVNRSNISKDML